MPLYALPWLCAALSVAQATVEAVPQLSGSCARGFDVPPGVSLAEARDAAQSCAEPVIRLLPGVHRLSRPLRLSAYDSGGRWVGLPGAVISGGVQVSGWSVVDDDDTLLSTRLPPEITSCPRQLYVAGVRARRTSDPLWSAVAGLRGNGSDDGFRLTAEGFETSSAAPLAWPEPANVELRHDSAFMQSRCGVRSVQESQTGGAIVRMAQPCWRLGLALGQMGAMKSSRYPGAVENIGITIRSGHFNCSESKRKLFYRARSEVELRRILKTKPANVIAPIADALLIADNVQSLSISGVVFQHSTYGEQHTGGPMSNDGYLERYGGIRYMTCDAVAASGVCYRTENESCAAGCCGKAVHKLGGCKLKMTPAAVEIRNSSQVTISNCTFRRLGAWGLALKQGTRFTTVMGSIFTDLSGGAVYVGNVNETRFVSPKPSSIHILDNHIESVGVEYQGSSGIHVFSAINTSVNHNRLRNIGYTAITFNWPCPQNESFSENMTMVANDVANYSTWGTDGGATHTLATCRRCLMDRNYFHDTACCGSKVTYIDSASSGYLIQNHVVDNCPDALWLYYQQGCGPSAARGQGCKWNPSFQTYAGCNATDNSKCCCNDGVDNHACPIHAPCWMRRSALDPFPITNISAFYHLNSTDLFPAGARAIIAAAGPRRRFL